jgi:uncharacterized protein (DUF2147 family)
MSRVRHSAAKTLSVILFSLLSAVPAGAADPVSPVGKWQTAGGESRYEVNYCGSGDYLCAKLTWLRSDARTPENLAYLNRLVVRGAVPTSSNKWRGTIRYDGQEIPGRMTLVGNDKMVLSGCQLIFCQTVEFQRI